MSQKSTTNRNYFKIILGDSMSLRYEDLRLDAEKKQGEIAEILNVKRNTYSKWENCINDMPIEKTNELANYYHTTLDYILGLSNVHKTVNKKLLIDWNVLIIRLLELRKASMLTQDVLSKKLGFPQTTYSQYERGIRKPTTMKLLLIAQFYNVSFDYLVGRTNDPKIIKFN